LKYKENTPFPVLGFTGAFGLKVGPKISSKNPSALSLDCKITRAVRL